MQTRPDFLQLLMNAHEDTDEGTEEDKQDHKNFREIYKEVTKRGMNNEDLIELLLLSNFV